MSERPAAETPSVARQQRAALEATAPATAPPLGQRQQPNPEARVHSPWRRSACDRCRSQKLRCVRTKEDDTSRPCTRCLRIRYPCFTSSAKPPGRISGRLPPPSESAASSADAGLNTPSAAASVRRRAARRESEDISLAPGQNSPMSVGWPFIQDEDRNEEAGVFEDGGMLMLTPSEEGQSLDFFEFLADKSPVGRESVAGVPSDDQASPASHSRSRSVPQALPLLMPFASASSPPGYRFFADPDDEHEHHVDVAGEDQIHMFSQAPAPLDHCSPGVLLARLLESLSTQLVRLNTEPWDLGVLSVTGSTRDSGEVDATAAEAFTNEALIYNPLSAILVSTAEFLDICKLFRAPESVGGADEASTATTAAEGSTNQLGSKRRFRSIHETVEGYRTQGAAKRAGRPGVLSTLPFTFSLPCSDLFPCFSTSSSSSSSLKRAESCPSFPSFAGPSSSQTIITNAQLLAVVSCYLQVVTIYNDIFSHLLFQLALPPPAQHQSASTIATGTSTHTSRRRHGHHARVQNHGGGQTVPGLVLAGYSVPLNAGLRMRLLVQVVEHQFEQIEQALGLPSQYCVSTGQHQQSQQHEDAGAGLLAGPEAATLLEAVMGLSIKLESGGADADANASGDSIGVVASLRETLRKAQRMRKCGG